MKCMTVMKSRMSWLHTHSNRSFNEGNGSNNRRKDRQTHKDRQTDRRTDRQTTIGKGKVKGTMLQWSVGRVLISRTLAFESVGG